MKTLEKKEQTSKKTIDWKEIACFIGTTIVLAAILASLLLPNTSGGNALPQNSGDDLFTEANSGKFLTLEEMSKIIFSPGWEKKVSNAKVRERILAARFCERLKFEDFISPEKPDGLREIFFLIQYSENPQIDWGENWNFFPEKVYLDDFLEKNQKPYSFWGRVTFSKKVSISGDLRGLPIADLEKIKKIFAQYGNVFFE